MSFDQVRIRELRHGDLVLYDRQPPYDPEPPYDPKYGDVVEGYGDGVLRLRSRETGVGWSVALPAGDPILRVRDSIPLKEMQVKDLRTGDIVLFHMGLPGNLGTEPARLYEVLSYSHRSLRLRLAIDPPADGIWSAAEDWSEVSVEYAPDETLFRNPPIEIVPGIRFDCPKYHRIEVPDRDGHLVRVFVGSLPDGAPMPRAEFLMAIPRDGSGWSPIPMLDDGRLRRCLRCGATIGHLPPSPRQPPVRSRPPRPPTRGSPGQEAIRRDWEQRLLRDNGPEWLEQNRERLDAEWEWILQMGL